MSGKQTMGGPSFTIIMCSAFRREDVPYAAESRNAKGGKQGAQRVSLNTHHLRVLYQEHRGGASAFPQS